MYSTKPTGFHSVPSNSGNRSTKKHVLLVLGGVVFVVVVTFFVSFYGDLLGARVAPGLKFKILTPSAIQAGQKVTLAWDISTEGAKKYPYEKIEYCYGSILKRKCALLASSVPNTGKAVVKVPANLPVGKGYLKFTARDPKKKLFGSISTSSSAVAVKPAKKVALNENVESDSGSGGGGNGGGGGGGSNDGGGSNPSPTPTPILTPFATTIVTTPTPMVSPDDGTPTPTPTPDLFTPTPTPTPEFPTPTLDPTVTPTPTPTITPTPYPDTPTPALPAPTATPTVTPTPYPDTPTPIPPTPTVVPLSASFVQPAEDEEVVRGSLLEVILQLIWGAQNTTVCGTWDLIDSNGNVIPLTSTDWASGQVPAGLESCSQEIY